MTTRRRSTRDAPTSSCPSPARTPINITSGAVSTEPRGIHIRQPADDVTAEELRAHIRDAGTIGSNRKGKGYATVLFKTQEEADSCLELFNASFATRKQSV
ncbi:hypothetical protein FN846DRAFT_982375 [Sphaerosporella brunnea]|uniref:RRM domain-containing protein n=1 Tax=Sphaerosporella brunnea TaxID=1250544 RepID=A0A5J5EC95_9PEZI|nr:hypothetical protein FN846DRAFT_982375 [Sphaerosporella brunnea]